MILLVAHNQYCWLYLTDYTVSQNNVKVSINAEGKKKRYKFSKNMAVRANTLQR